MINKKLLLNTHKFGDDAVLVSASANGFKDCYLDTGIPCIIDKNIYDRVLDDDLISALFTYNEGKEPSMIHKARKGNIVIENSRCIADNPVKQIDKFDFSKIKDLPTYVKEHGSVLFSLFTPNPISAAKATGKSAIEFLNRIYSDLISRYSHHSVTYINYPTSSTTMLGDLRYIIHFIDIPNCLSVLNQHKVDGMGFIFNIVSLNGTLEHKRINSIYSISIILSNFKENIFVIDGVNIKSKVKLERKYILDAIGIVKKNMEQRKKYFLFQKKNDLGDLKEKYTEKHSKGKISSERKSYFCEKAECGEVTSDDNHCAEFDAAAYNLVDAANTWAKVSTSGTSNNGFNVYFNEYVKLVR